MSAAKVSFQRYEGAPMVRSSQVVFGTWEYYQATGELKSKAFIRDVAFTDIAFEGGKHALRMFDDIMASCGHGPYAFENDLSNEDYAKERGFDTYAEWLADTLDDAIDTPSWKEYDLCHPFRFWVSGDVVFWVQS